MCTGLSVFETDQRYIYRKISKWKNTEENLILNINVKNFFDQKCEIMSIFKICEHVWKKLKWQFLMFCLVNFQKIIWKTFYKKWAKFFSIFHKFGNLKSKLIFVKEKLENSEVERNVKKQLKFNL